jgi:TonB family protein
VNEKPMQKAVIRVCLGGGLLALVCLGLFAIVLLRLCKPTSPLAPPNKGVSVSTALDSAIQPELKKMGCPAVIVPRILHKILPEYPQKAISRHLSGKVVARLSVDGYGKVVDVKIMNSTDHVFDKPVVQALLQWQYEATPQIQKANGIMWLVATVRFEM